MAVNTWVGGDSGNETDYGTAANWNTTGETNRVPTDADDVIIANVSDDCVLDGSRSVKSFVVEAGGDFNGSTEMLTVVGKNGSGYAVDIDGDIVGTNSNITITTPEACDLDLKPTAGAIRHLEINHASCVGTWTADTTLSGNLTITAGEFKAQGGATLEVAGTTSVTGTLTCVSGDVSLGSGKTDGYGLNVASGGTFTGGTGTHTWGSANLQASTTLTSGTTTINGVGGGHNYAFWADNSFTHNSGTVAFTRNGDQKFGESGSDAPTRTFNNLTVNKAGGELTWETDNPFACAVAGNLTITAGELDTGPNDVALTVTGDVNIASGGTLTGNASAISMNSLTLGESSAGGTYNATSGTTTITGYRSSTNNAIYANGAIVHNSGTFAFTDSSNYSGIEIQIESGAGSAGTYFNDVTFSGNSTYRFPYYGSNDVTVSGDLTMSGTPDIKQWRRSLIVDGNVTIGDGCTWDCEGSGVADVSSDFTAGSLQINSGGTFKASSGTTTITSRTGGGYSWYAPTTGSIFNHNNGTVKLTYTGNETFWQGTGFYNLEIAGSTHYEHRYSDLTDSSGLIVYNNFTITEGRVRFNQAGDSVTVHGLTKMVGGQYCNTGTAPSGTHNYGNVVIEGGTWKLTSGTCNMSGIRKLGGTLS